MKLHTFLSSVALTMAMTVNAADLPDGITKLYLVGEASPAGWDRGAAPELTTHGEDTNLVWTGYLGRGQFKMLTSRDSWNSVVSNDWDNYGVTVDIPMDIQYNADGGSDDWKWYNNTPGYYVLTVDPSQYTLTVSPIHIYLVGGASSYDGDKWGCNVELTRQENGDYTWSGQLGSGELKFRINNYNWDSFVSADKSGCDVMPGMHMGMKLCPDGGSDDWKWNVFTGSEYDITVNPDLGTFLIEPKELYLIGGASPSGWSHTDDPVLERQQSGEYVWTGNIGGGEIKVALSKTGWDSFVSAEKPGCDVRLNQPMPYKFCRSGDNDNDWKWNSTMAGEYTIKVNLVERTFTVSMDLPELYLVGDASPSGWDRGSAPTLKKDAKGNNTWTGFLGTGTFKLVVSRTSANWESIMPADCDGYGAVIGKPMTFAFNSGKDWKWHINEGIYSISVNMAENTITVSDFNTPIYLVGDASPEGWNRGDAPELVMNADGEYVWVGDLKAGNFKFLVDRNRWDALGSTESSNANIVNGTPMGFRYLQEGGADVQWVIPSAGKYRLAVNPAAKTMTASRVTELYLIGEATPAGWTREKAPELISVDGDVFTWTGHLGKGQFKILKSRDSWDSYVSADWDNYGVQPGQEMSMRDTGDDNKWYNNYPGNYTVTANIATGKLTVTPTRGIVDPENMGHPTAQFELERIADDLYRYCGNLTPGKYRLVFSDGSALRVNDDESFGATINHNAGSEFIVASETDRMQVFVHTSAKHITFSAYTPYEGLYAIGDFNDWAFADDYKFTASTDDDDTFEWEGRIDPEKGTGFRIAAVSGDSRYDILPYVGGSAFSDTSHFFTGAPQAIPTDDEDNNAPEKVKAAAPGDPANWVLANELRKYSFKVNMYNREVKMSSQTVTSVQSLAKDRKIKVFARDGILTVVTAEPTVISVYNLAGLLVAKHVCDGRCELRLDHGVYMVATPDEVVKVLM